MIKGKGSPHRKMFRMEIIRMTSLNLNVLEGQSQAACCA